MISKPMKVFYLPAIVCLFSSLLSVANAQKCSFVADTFDIGANVLTAMGVGDLDGDGDIDVVTGDINDPNVTVLLNQGDGTFVEDGAYSTAGGIAYIAIGDLDGDLDLDIAATNGLDDLVAVLFNNGKGVFEGLSTFNTIGDEPYDIVLGDIDGDGDLDPITANAFGDNVSVFVNNGNGELTLDNIYPVGDGPMSVELADLDNDGDLDLVTSDGVSDSISILLNNGGGTFALHDQLQNVGDLSLGSVAIGDFDGDGALDLATSNFLTDEVVVVLNNGDATFGTGVLYAVGGLPIEVEAGDLDGDGDLDLVTGILQGTTGSVQVLWNNGDGTFVDGGLFGSFPHIPFALRLTDLDGNAGLDFLLSGGGDTLLRGLNQCGGVLLGDIDQNGQVNLLDVAPFIELLTSGKFQAEADINQDGSVDLLDVQLFVDLISG